MQRYAFLLLVGMLAGIGATAQTVLLDHQGQQLPSGSTLVIEAQEASFTDPATGLTSTQVEFSPTDPQLFNPSTAAEAAFSCTYTLDDPTAEWLCCGITKNCVMLSERNGTLEGALAAGERRPLDFHPTFAPRQYGERVAQLTFHVGALPATHYTLRFVYRRPAAIGAPTAAPHGRSALRDLSGRRIHRPQKGQIYLQGQRKVVF